MKTILTVDDSPLDNMISEMLLRRAFPGYEIIIFSNPSEALHFIRQNEHGLPGMILLDINMPLISGWDLAEELVKQGYQGNLFMLTSSVFRADEKRARSYSCLKDYFIKPLNDEMIGKIKEHLASNLFEV